MKSAEHIGNKPSGLIGIIAGHIMNIIHKNLYRTIINIVKNEIVNGYPKEGSKWWDVVRFKTEKEYITFLEKNGFESIRVDILKNSIFVVARKR